VTWFDIDGARRYLAQHGAEPPPRKALYRMVKHGLKVARAEGKGSRMFFCAEWIDEFLVKQADKRNPEAGKASGLSFNGAGDEQSESTRSGGTSATHTTRAA
jgi:hypothetical protein